MSKKTNLPSLKPEQVVQSTKASYRLNRKVGQGSFGELWLAMMGGKDAKGKQVTCLVALKFEDENSPTPSIRPEALAYDALGTHKNLPIVYDFFGTLGRSCLAMELLGKSLENRMDWSDRHMTVKDMIQIGIHVLDAIQHVHSKRYIHRDIKPDNFLFGPQGSKRQDILRIIDFGLCKRYMDDNGKHIEFNTESAKLGTPRYMSIRAHQGHQQSRRDDLESVAYMLIYLLRDRMPWDGVKDNDPRKRNEEIMKLKQSTPLHDLLGTVIPGLFGKFVDYVKALKFKEDPDYDKLRGYLTGCAHLANIKLDGKFSWSNAGDDSELSIKPQLNSNAKIKNRSNK